MTGSLFYLLKVNFVFVVLFVSYRMFFSRLTFYRTNRILLLLLLPVSFILPALTLSFGAIYVKDINVPEFMESSLLVSDPTVELSTACDESYLIFIVKIIYAVGLMLFFSKLVLSAFKIIRLKQQACIGHIDGFTILKADVSQVFSVFNWIFIPVTAEREYDDLIIEHEKIHARKRHTLDLIVTEIFAALLWFNPFVYFFRRSIRTIHEYQVDASVLDRHDEKHRYLQLLLDNLELKYCSVDPCNYFNGLTIKKRVKMITKNKSSRKNVIRYALLVPVLAVLIMSFTNRKGEKPSLFPLEKEADYKITLGYGVEFENPVTKETVIHKGIDIAALKGTDVLAAAGGTVVKAASKKGYGNLIVTDHGNGFESWYAHLDDLLVAEGQTIKKGQVIGHVGSTGNSTGPHLHFEIRKNEKNVNPFDYVK